MLGVCIQYVDYDDWEGRCKCKNSNNSIEAFPATSVIASASVGIDSSLVKTCPNF